MRVTKTCMHIDGFDDGGGSLEVKNVGSFEELERARRQFSQGPSVGSQPFRTPWLQST